MTQDNLITRFAIRWYVYQCNHILILQLINYTNYLLHYPGAKLVPAAVILDEAQIFFTPQCLIVSALYKLCFILTRLLNVSVFSCIIGFLLGLLFTQRCGNYFVTMFDDYSATLPLIIVVVFETFSVSWLYGADR